MRFIENDEKSRRQQYRPSAVFAQHQADNVGIPSKSEHLPAQRATRRPFDVAEEKVNPLFGQVAAHFSQDIVELFLKTAKLWQVYPGKIASFSAR